MENAVNQDFQDVKNKYYHLMTLKKFICHHQLNSSLFFVLILHPTIYLFSSRFYIWLLKLLGNKIKHFADDFRVFKQEKFGEFWNGNKYTQKWSNTLHPYFTVTYIF